MSLRQSAESGARWTIGSSAVGGAIQILQFAVLARLLSPVDFGLMAMMVVVIRFAQLYADLGVGNAIIYRQDATLDHLSTLYWTNILAGVLVFAVLVAATPLLVLLYAEPRLASYLPFVAASILILAVGQQYQILLQKHLRFRELAVAESVAAAVGAVVTIAAAFAGQGVVALIYGLLTSALIRTLLYIGSFVREWRPTLHFDYRDLRNYLSFSLYQLGERSINYFSQHADQLLIGAVLGATTLGYYNLAYNLVIWPMQRINPALTRIAFPIFARVQDDVEHLKLGYMTLQRVLASLNFPILVGISSVAPILVPLVFGEKWLPSVALIQVLAFVALLRSTGNPTGALLLARGRASLTFCWNLGIVIIQLPAIWMVARYFGSLGVAVILVSLQFIYFWVSYYILIRSQLGPCLGLYLNSMGPAIITSLPMGLLLGIMSTLDESPSILWLSSQIAVGMVIYGFLNWFFYRDNTVAVFRLVRGQSA